MKDAYYFSHDSNAQNDEKILKLRFKYGWEGYGIYWALIERLREATKYKIEILSIPSLSLAMNVDVKTLEEIIKEFKLFEIDNNFFFSKSLIKRMKKAEEKSAKARISANYRWKKDMRTHSERNTDAMQTQCDGNAIKEKKRKENNIYTEFISFLNQTTGKNYRGNKKIESSLNARLKENYTLENIKTAIKNCANDKWHIENNLNFLTPEFILRVDKLDKFLNTGSKGNAVADKILMQNSVTASERLCTKEEADSLMKNGSGWSPKFRTTWKAS